MELKAEILEDLTRTAAFVALYFVLFLLAKAFKDLLTPYKINDELTKKDNLAVALTMCGYYFGVVAIFVGSLVGPTQGLYKDLMAVGGYSLLGIMLLNISRYFNDKVILRKFCNIEQITKNHNVAVGAVQFGTYVATGLIAAGAITGTGGGVETAIVFFVLGQLSLLVFTLIYNAITPYCVHDELDKKNVAAGAALGGTLIALGIIILNGVQGDFISWQENLMSLAIINIMAFAFLPIVRFVMDKLVIPGDDLSKEIVEDKNLGAGLLEATVAISFAIVLKSVL
jgi:uncharacterized membrane protein YjfL (UPF0719 family)